MNMKLLMLATIFVVGLAISQVQAFPQVPDRDGFQIDSVSRMDNTPVEELLFDYIKLLEEMNHNDAPPSTNEIAEDQTNALCPTANCSCNITLLILHGVIRDADGNPTDNCTIYNVPYCEGVCSSSYR